MELDEQPKKRGGTSWASSIFIMAAMVCFALIMFD